MVGLFLNFMMCLRLLAKDVVGLIAALWLLGLLVPYVYHVCLGLLHFLLAVGLFHRFGCFLFFVGGLFAVALLL